jgi:hypothetical protein
MPYNNESLQAAYSSIKRVPLALNPIVLSEYAVDPTAQTIKTAPMPETAEVDPTAPIVNEAKPSPTYKKIHEIFMGENADAAFLEDAIEKLLGYIKTLPEEQLVKILQIVSS